MRPREIVVSGAREHNLKNITVRIPAGSLTVVTGLSGSGKSSLAFDTLYAEGQRRYVESLSAYARQFLGALRKPDVDFIEGLSPAIAIEQRTAGANPRSIVATSTEIHDYLRLLFAHAGRRHCPKCGRPVRKQTAQQIVDALLAQPNRTRVVLLAPLLRRRKGHLRDVLEAVRKQGFLRVRVDGTVHELDAVPALAARTEHDLDVVVDRLLITSRIRPRLVDSVELGLKQGDGTLHALLRPDGDDEAAPPVEEVYSERYTCAACGVAFAELDSRSFSFNSPYGACPACAGLGTRLVVAPDLVAPDPALPLDDGAIAPWRRGGRRLILYLKGLLRAVAKHHGVDPGTPFGDLPEAVRNMVLHGSGDEPIAFTLRRGEKVHAYSKPFEGVLANIERRFAESSSSTMRTRLRAYMRPQPCDACDSARLRPASLACRVGDRSIADVTRMSVRDAVAFFDSLSLSTQEALIVRDVLREIRSRLSFLAQIGLDYLTLDRESGSLSGGEAQRIRLATQIGSGLTGVLYVLDEPSIGLHPRDNDRLIALLLRLRDAGNTVVVVEHDAEMMRRADHLLDLGPGAGRHGGEVVASGTPAEVAANPASLTGRYLSGDIGIPVPTVRRAAGPHRLTVVGARANNLRDLTVAFPLGLFTCVTGVSGSGKSTLVDDILSRALFRHFHGSSPAPGAHTRLEGVERLDKAIVIDQSPVGRTPRSNAATYTGAFSHIRDLFAALPESRVRGFGPGRFSFNTKGGRCESCKGDGMLRLEMHFLPDVYVTCEACNGRRYNEDTLHVRYGGLHIAEVLALTVDEALEFFRSVPAIASRLHTLSEVGLGYLQLGQSATTLSGGEAQRVKLSAELARRATGSTLYLLDEPTTGLHFADVQRLLHVLFRLRDAGNTIVVIEHNLDVIKCADYILDLGPGGGDAGGNLVAAGTPEEVVACPESVTGKHLRALLRVAR